jgi:predicted ester cyclase
MTPMSIDQHKAVIAQFASLVRKPDVAKIRDLFTPDFRLHVPNYPDWPPGYDGAIRMFVQMNALFPDLELIAEDIFGDADRVCVRWRYKGTQSGSFEGRIGDGSRFESVGLSIYRFEGNRIAEDWGVDVPLPPEHPWRTR